MESLDRGDPASVETAGRRYRLLARIGSGGMGVVYLGRTAAGRSVAVKRVHAELADDPEFRERFRRELDAARAVGGGFTAAVVDADPDAPVPWLVTEFLPAVPLRDAVRLAGPLPEDAVWELAAGVAEALRAIHAAGVVHRDLKPANVLFTADGPRVIDFGISRALDAATVTAPGSRVGSGAFMSPEQVAGVQVGPAGDVFSFGSLLAFARTGVEPFGADTWEETLRRVQTAEPRLDGITGDLRDMIESCLDRDPARRPSAERLAGLAGGAAGDGGLPQVLVDEIARRRHEADNPPSGPPTGQLRTRRVALWGAGAAVAAVAVAVSLVWFTIDDPGTAPATARTAPARVSSPPARPTQGQTRRLEISMKGTAEIRSLTYTVNGRTTTLKDVELPWKKEFTLPVWPPRSAWKVVYKYGPGEVEVIASVNGRPVSRGGGGGTGSGTGSAGGLH